MRLLNRNLRPIYYCLFKERVPVLDEAGHRTGQFRNVYEAPVKIKAHVGSQVSFVMNEQFGHLEAYDNTITIADVDTPITDTTVLFVDKEPEFDADGTPIYDYFVRRVGKSLNVVNIEVRKETVRG